MTGVSSRLLIDEIDGVGKAKAYNYSDVALVLIRLIVGLKRKGRGHGGLNWFLLFIVVG